MLTQASELIEQNQKNTKMVGYTIVYLSTCNIYSVLSILAQPHSLLITGDKTISPSMQPNTVN